jgi:hypothetical protein
MFSSKLPNIQIDQFEKTDLEFVLKYTPAFQQKRQEIALAVKYYSNELNALPGNVELEIYKLPANVEENILKQLPKGLLDKETPDIFFAKFTKSQHCDILLPHTDIGRRCGINIYLESSDNQITTFYNSNHETEQLEILETFVAQSGESWVLDTTVMHSVIMPDDSPRSFISMSFRKLKLKNLLEYFLV